MRDSDVAVAMRESFNDLDDLRRLPLLVNRAGYGVTLGDVAEVDYGLPPEDGRELLDGERFVELHVKVGSEADTIDASKRVRAAIDAEAEKFLVEPLRLRIGRDASEVIEHELSTLQGNGLGGMILVLLILTVFLGLRVSAMTALGLPFCYLGIVLLLPLFDIEFNLVSLAAMLLVVGILVDDAIIVSEEFCQLLNDGMKPRQAAVEAVLRVGKPVLGMVATTVVAFMPLLILQGEEAWLIRPLPVVIIAALVLSLFESFFILPNHLRHWLARGAVFKERRFVTRLRRYYAGVLAYVLKLRYLTALLVFGLMGLAVYLVMGPLKFEQGLSLRGEAMLLVELDERAASLDDLDKKLAPVYAQIDALPEELVERVVTSLGRSYTPNYNLVRGWKYAMVSVLPPGNFVEAEERRHEIARRMRAALPDLRGGGIRSVRFVDDRDGESREVVTVYVSGGDRVGFEAIQEDIRNSLGEVEDVRDVYMDESRLQVGYQFAPDDAQVLAYGLTRGHLQDQLRQYFAANELLRIRRKGEELDVFWTPQKETAPSLETLQAMTVMTDRGVAVPLRYLGTWERTELLKRIEHRDMLRMFRIDVLYDQDKTDAEKISAAIDEQLAGVRAAYPGYHVSVKPPEELAKAKSWALQVALLCLGLIYVVLVITLNSLIQPVVVLFAIPFGFIGVVLVFFLHGLPLGVMAIIGILGLAGVVVNDSLVMTSTINDQRRKHPEAPMRDVVREGASRRFQAVLLTSLSTLAGIFPLAYGVVGDAGWMRPMVLAVGWGLLFATVLTLFFIPCLLLMLDDGKRFFAYLRGFATRKNIAKDSGVRSAA